MPCLEFAAFRTQRRHAFDRDIEFEFDFFSWVNWWELNLGKNWFKKRGRGSGKYCMARIKDKGPYSWGNTECILFEKNASDRHAESSKLTAGKVRKIYLAFGNTSEVGKKFNVDSSIVKNIKDRRSWKRFTKDLGVAPRVTCRRHSKEKIKEVFLASGNFKEISLKTGVDYSTVWMIKHKKLHIKITNDLAPSRNSRRR